MGTLRCIDEYGWHGLYVLAGHVPTRRDGRDRRGNEPKIIQVETDNRKKRVGNERDTDCEMQNQA